MNKCILVANGDVSSKVLTQNISLEDFLVGVDKGAICLLNNHFPIHLAIGDFDSVTKREIVLIKKNAYEIKVFSDDKDYTDTELALQIAIEKGYRDIVLIGAVGSRIDHTLANILLLEKYDKKAGQIKMVDDNNEVEVVRKIKFINKNPHLPNVSLISLTDTSTVSLTGFKYPLKNKKIKRGQTLCISNELTRKEGKVEVKKGKVLMVRSRD